MSETHKSPTSSTFSTAVASYYERFMVPMVFEPFANELVSRLAGDHLGDLLEIAAGTGIVTRKLADLPEKDLVSITATDISEAMIEIAKQIGRGDRITWQRADAAELPFEDQTFDTVICQFGVMFFSDRVKAYREVRRVLRPGGKFIFSSWDRMEENDFVNTTMNAVATLFPQDPPTFAQRVPHGYFDIEAIARDLNAAGFQEKTAWFDSVTEHGRAESARIPAQAFVQGTPLRLEIESRDPGMLDRATGVVEEALVEKFGKGPIVGKMRAYLITATR